MSAVVTDFDLWRKRWNALEENIKQAHDHYESRHFDRHDTIVTLLQALEEFAQGNLNDFFERFSSGRLEVKNFPPENVFAVILSRVGFDLEVIERAAEQRLMVNVTRSKTLEVADKLAWQALKPALGKVIQGDTTVITYFQRLAEVRVVPYANVAIVGVPFTSTSVKMDFLAIPHEVGHYVFWHRIKPTYGWWKDNIANDAQKNSTNPEWAFHKWWLALANDTYRKWYEELFADVYGCLVAGPVIALDFQEQALHYASQDFLQRQDKHPTPFLRPNIYHKVLQQETKWEGIAGRLQEYWERRREDRWNTLKTTKENREKRIDLENALSPKTQLVPNSGYDVDNLIDLALRQLDLVKSNWSGPVENFTVEEFGNQFDHQIDALTQISPPSDKVAAKPWSGFSSIEGTKLPDQIISESEWLPVFQAEGWTSGGGENDPAH